MMNVLINEPYPLPIYSIAIATIIIIEITFTVIFITKTIINIMIKLYNIIRTSSINIGSISSSISGDDDDGNNEKLCQPCVVSVAEVRRFIIREVLVIQIIPLIVIKYVLNIN